MTRLEGFRTKPLWLVADHWVNDHKARVTNNASECGAQSAVMLTEKEIQMLPEHFSQHKHKLTYTQNHPLLRSDNVYLL